MISSSSIMLGWKNEFCNMTLKLEMDGEQATIAAADTELNHRRSLRKSRFRSIRLQENQEQSQTSRQTRNTTARVRRHRESQEESQRTQTRNTTDRASRQLESLEQSETWRQARRVQDRHCQTVRRQANLDSWRQF